MQSANEADGRPSKCGEATCFSNHTVAKIAATSNTIDLPWM